LQTRIFSSHPLSLSLSLIQKAQIALRIVIVGVCKERLHLKPLVHEPRVEKATGPMPQDVELCPLDEQYREESGSLLRTAANLFPTVRAISAGALVEVWTPMGAKRVAVQRPSFLRLTGMFPS
jgi:hypothetical protein